MIDTVLLWCLGIFVRSEATIHEILVFLLQSRSHLTVLLHDRVASRVVIAREL